MQEQILKPSEFVSLINQTLEYAYPVVTIEGELSELRISKNRWVYFKLKDETAVVDFFGTVYQLNQPLEDGMMVRVIGRPRLSDKWGFSVNVEQIRPTGEGAFRRAFELLKAKLAGEGLFDPQRKRPIPVYPQTIGLISSAEAAGAKDFLKILDQRWRGVGVQFASIQVQGEAAPGQIVAAIDYFNQLARPVDVLVLVRGGGSAEDLWSFNTEPVVRAIAGSRSPVVVGVGHEVDTTLSDMAADVRAATPTDAATLVVPNRREFASQLKHQRARLSQQINQIIGGLSLSLRSALENNINQLLNGLAERLSGLKRAVRAYDPEAALKRGYSIILLGGQVVSRTSQVKTGDKIKAKLSDGSLAAEVTNVQAE
ncbi:MAG TPA: exodeoxyribonuclease VII large subunit [Candidatus Saccharimonadales bacterium]